MIGPSTCYNLAFTNKDKLARAVFNKGNSTSISTFAVSWDFTSIFTSALALPNIYTNINPQKISKLVLKLFIKGQKYIQVNFVLWNRAFKT